jgi:hypothetical protein
LLSSIYCSLNTPGSFCLCYAMDGVIRDETLIEKDI